MPTVTNGELTRVRIALGMNKVTFAKEMGISRPTLWNWETKGIRSMRFATLSRFEELRARTESTDPAHGKSQENTASILQINLDEALIARIAGAFELSPEKWKVSPEDPESQDKSGTEKKKIVITFGEQTLRLLYALGADMMESSAPGKG